MHRGDARVVLGGGTSAGCVTSRLADAPQRHRSLLWSRPPRPRQRLVRSDWPIRRPRSGMVANLFQIGSNRDRLISAPLSPMAIPHPHSGSEEIVANSARFDSELLPDHRQRLTGPVELYSGRGVYRGESVGSAVPSRLAPVRQTWIGGSSGSGCPAP